MRNRMRFILTRVSLRVPRPVAAAPVAGVVVVEVGLDGLASFDGGAGGGLASDEDGVAGFCSSFTGFSSTEGFGSFASSFGFGSDGGGA